MHKSVDRSLSQRRERYLFALFRLEPDDLVFGPQMQAKECLNLSDDLEEVSGEILAINEVIAQFCARQSADHDLRRLEHCLRIAAEDHHATDRRMHPIVQTPCTQQPREIITKILLLQLKMSRYRV